MKEFGWKVLVSVGIALSASECGAEPFPVQVNYGEGSYVVWSGWTSTMEHAHPAVYLLNEGDMVSIDSDDDNSGYFEYRASYGRVLDVTSDEWSSRIGGKVVTASLASDVAVEWLAHAPKADLAGLRQLDVPENLDTATLSAIMRLARFNSSVGLAFHSQQAISQVLPFFQPRYVSIEEFDPDFHPFGHNLRNLETVLVSAESTNLAYLPRLPGFARLFLSGWKVGESGPLPAGIAGLRQLLIFGGDLGGKDNALSNARDLDELWIAVSEDVGVKCFSHLSHLRTLILNQSEVSGDLAGLPDLKSLVRVGLPANTTQKQFAELIANHPNLKTLEIVHSDSITDLEPLRKVKGLENLVLTGGPYKNLDVLKELHSLRFIGIPDTSRAGVEERAAIRKALPHALVVPASEYTLCLGSGWILLLIPIGVATWWLATRRRKRMRSAADAA